MGRRRIARSVYPTDGPAGVGQGANGLGALRDTRKLAPGSPVNRRVGRE